jgi:CBS domain containing-hemolysin-like protein
LEPPLFASLLIALLSLAALVLLSSYEATFGVLSRSTLEKMHENQVRRAGLMLRLYEPRHRLFLLARLGQALSTIGLSAALLWAAQSSAHLLGGPGWAGLGALAATALLTLAAAVPRRIRFEDEGEQPHIPGLALAFIPLRLALWPLVLVVERLAAGTHILSEELKAEKEVELRNLVEAESETGVLEEGERDMIQGVFGFHETIVREVMVPRVDIAAVEQGATLAELLQAIEGTRHSRVPVYDETLDKIRGVVYAKDLLQLLGRPELDLNTRLLSFIEQPGTPFLHEAFYVPETKKIDDLLHEMRVNRIRLALVVDEYGGTAGLVTTEDLVEEIVGDLQDEYDDEEALFHWVEPGQVLIVNPRIHIDDLNELLETDLPNEGFETLGGFIYDHLGQVPDQGQHFTVDHLQVEILEVDGQRLAKVRIRRLPPDAPASPAESA